MIAQKQSSTRHSSVVKVIASIVGVGLFLLLIIASIFIIKKQQDSKETTFAPNAPQSRPQASELYQAWCPETQVFSVAPPPSNITDFKEVANNHKTASCNIDANKKVEAVIIGHKLVKENNQYRYQVLLRVTRNSPEIAKAQVDTHIFYCPTPSSFNDYNNDQDTPQARVCGLQPGQNINDVLARVNVDFGDQDSVEIIAQAPYTVENLNQCGGWQADARIRRYQLANDDRMLDCQNSSEGENFTYANCNQFGRYPQDDCGLPASWCQGTPPEPTVTEVPAPPTATPTSSPTPKPNATNTPTPTQIAEITPTCPLTADEDKNEFIIYFKGKLYNQYTESGQEQPAQCQLTGNEAINTTLTKTTQIPAGNYKVTLVAFDNHSQQPASIKTKQKHEQYHLVFTDSIKSKSTEDIKDDQNYATTVVNNQTSPIKLTSNIKLTQLTTKHSFCSEDNNPYPAEGANSLSPVCALFSPITSSTTPTETPTNTPTVTSQPTNTPVPRPTNTPVPAAPGQPTNTPVPVPTNTPAPLAAAAPTNTPAPGCNDVCQTNADCNANANYICYQTGDGTSRCRLDSNPESETCSPKVAQPTLPSTLPETGVAEWTTWLKVGLATLGVGAALLLLL